MLCKTVSVCVALNWYSKGIVAHVVCQTGTLKETNCLHCAKCIFQRKTCLHVENCILPALCRLTKHIFCFCIKKKGFPARRKWFILQNRMSLFPSRCSSRKKTAHTLFHRPTRTWQTEPGPRLIKRQSSTLRPQTLSRPSKS